MAKPVSLTGSPQYRAQEIVKSHGPAGARRACGTCVAKAEKNARRYASGDDSRLAHYRRQRETWRAIQKAVEGIVS